MHFKDQGQMKKINNNKQLCGLGVNRNMTSAYTMFKRMEGRKEGRTEGNALYHSVCFTSHGALAGTKHSSVGPPTEGSNRHPLHHEQTLLARSYISLPLNAWS